MRAYKKTSSRVTFPSRCRAPDAAGTDPGRSKGSGKGRRDACHAKNSVILAGYTGRNPESFDDLVKLAELLAIPVINLARRHNFPNNHPLNLARGSDVIEKADLILSLDVRDLVGPLVKVDRTARKMVYRTREKVQDHRYRICRS